MDSDPQLDIDQIWEHFHKTHDDYYRNLPIMKIRRKSVPLHIVQE
jgi:hypothetical protein